MSTCLDRAKKKLKSLKIETFDQTSKKRTPPNSGHLRIADNFDQTRRCPLFRSLTITFYWNFRVVRATQTFFLCFYRLRKPTILTPVVITKPLFAQNILGLTLQWTLSISTTLYLELLFRTKSSVPWTFMVSLEFFSISNKNLCPF